MRTSLIYPIEEVLKRLPGFHLVTVTNHHYHEDGDWDTYETRLTNQPEIVKVKTQYGFGVWENAEYINAEGKKMYADGASYVNERPDRVKVYEIISPKVNILNDYIERTSNLEKWLIRHNVDISELDELAQEYKIYDTIEYPGVSDVSLTKSGHWCHSSENLVLDEREIEFVLNGIADKVLRKKIDGILYARVFKRK